MAKNRYPHLFLKDWAKSSSYTALRQIRHKKLPEIKRTSHADRLHRQLSNVWDQSNRISQDRNAIALPTRDGTYIEFRGSAGYELLTKSLEDMRSKRIRLCNIRQLSTSDGNQVMATIFIPNSKKGYFLRRISEYAEKQTKKGMPRHNDFVRSIEDIQLAMLESFWTDPPELLPAKEPVWCEVWLPGHGCVRLYIGYRCKQRPRPVALSSLGLRLPLLSS